ncbi:DNA topoisomerase type I [Eptesipox virus]|uniref:DNA topoisomerase n=1 Tax=Eptesipox virus TaxID=1329402 RepID=A0A220T6F1_9POXV|nr:DNA topoisomerase type I [Eptesipox virus]ASK51282.1 DNA topoisomerase type I [Eptesipox virus]WAH71040.1 DNA topoisomerase type I [Eptesipox virus]
MREFYYKDGKLFLDSTYKQEVSKKNPTYEILKHIKIPSHLSNVIIYEQTYEQSLSRLVFIGTDAKGRKQYFYGKLHISQRNENRNKIFLKVYKIINSINNFIDNNISLKTIDDVQFQLAIFMLIETSFFIRIGKMCYLKENDTVGLLTLKNKHIIFEKDKILIKFIGKDKVSHEFIVRKTNKLYKPLKKLTNHNKMDEFLFSKLNERKVYTFMKQFNIRLKDLRTYGVNYTFLYNFWTNVRSLTPLPSVKKLISMSIKQTAEIVGHTPSISKNAYMATTVLTLLQDNKIIKSIEHSTFNEFVNLIVKHIHENN